MRFAALVLTFAVAVASCARAKPPASQPAPDVTDRLAEADAVVRIGCYDCLTDALREYETIRALPNLLQADAEIATAGAVRAALLLDLRARELGMTDEGYLGRANDLIGAREDLRARFAPHLLTVDSIPWRIARFDMPMDAEGLRRMQELRAHFPALLAERRALADEDPLSAYGWVAFVCTHGSNRDDRSREALVEPLSQMRGAPIVEYRLASCGINTDTTALTDLLDRQSRFVEVTYLLGQAAMGRQDLEQAERLFTIGYQWRARWPAVTVALANVSFAFEEPARALDFYDRTLALSPEHPEALVGRVKSLSLLLRHAEAFTLIDRILGATTRVFPGDAYYWRAWNDLHVDRLDEAWADIEAAEKLWVNSEVSKLGGIIAYRRRELDVARKRFEAARTLAPGDCETVYYLGNVHAEQKDWPLTASTFTSAAICIERARERLGREIVGIEASNWSEDRRARQIARREEQIAAAARMLATAWFNAAAAHFNLGHRDDARRFAERLVDDEQFAGRAKEILKRLQ
jgi:tetratricopeptide (TPR) repeat protein